MKCHGQFDPNKVHCELCARISDLTYESCKVLTKKRRDHEKAVREFEDNCPYRTTRYDEYTPYDACEKKKRNDDNCNGEKCYLKSLKQ